MLVDGGGGGAVGELMVIGGSCTSTGSACTCSKLLLLDNVCCLCAYMEIASIFP